MTQHGEGYGGQQEQAGSFIYRYERDTGSIEAVITEMERPNGLAFNKEEAILYVSDTSQVNYPQGHHYVRAYDIDISGNFSNSRVFANIEPGQPDKLIVHESGLLLISSADRVQIYNPSGVCIGN